MFGYFKLSEIFGFAVLAEKGNISFANRNWRILMFKCTFFVILSLSIFWYDFSSYASASSENSIQFENRQIDSDIIIKAVTEGKNIYLANCIIVNELNLDYDSLRHDYPSSQQYLIVSSTVSIDNCVFSEHVHFDKILFKEPIKLLNCEFKKTFALNFCMFASGLFLGEIDKYDGESVSIFLEDVTLYECRIKGGFDCTNCIFKKSFLFNSCYVGKGDMYYRIGASFRGVLFQGKASFAFSNFETYTRFSGGIIGPGMRRLTSKSCEFWNEASFREVKFLDEVWFSRVLFREKVIFSGAVFKAPTYFYGAIFFKDVDFNPTPPGINPPYATKFLGPSFFDNVSFRQSADFTAAVFANDICFSNVSEFLRLEINWNALKNQLLYDERFYTALIRNYKFLGQFEFADGAFHQYRKSRRKLNYQWYNPQRALEYIFLDLSCGYGVKPHRTIFFGLFIILLFSLLYIRKGALEERRREDDKRTSSSLETNRILTRIATAIYFSVNTFSTVGYGDWYPSAEYFTIFSKRIIRYRSIAVIEGVIGWLVLSLFIVSLAKVWLR